jgi:putative tryptophan/tyrosine transport system substrate-binding protein
MSTRRNFIAGIGATAAWPAVVHGREPGERMRLVGVLMPLAADDPDAKDRIEAFLQGLQQLGWNVGRNLRIEYRWSGGNPDDARKCSAELAALAPDVILANGAAAVEPLLRETRNVPIVFAFVSDPVAAGFVESLARPGGNATGFLMLEYGLSAKWAELLKQVAPHVTRAAVLRDPSITAGSVSWPPSSPWRHHSVWS